MAKTPRKVTIEIIEEAMPEIKALDPIVEHITSQFRQVVAVKKEKFLVLGDTSSAAESLTPLGVWWSAMDED